MMSSIPAHSAPAESAVAFFDILAPARWHVPVVFNSPHSGGHVPERLRQLTSLTAQQLRSSEDSFVDELFAACAEWGAPLMHSLISRAYLDLNREPFELDARMFAEKLPGYVNCASPRVASGLGTIPRTVGDGLVIYPAKLSLAEALERIETCYRPYHRTLNALLSEAHAAAGLSLLVDCHSMPASAVSHLASRHQAPIDIVLGDRFGAACDGEVSSLIENHCRSAGLTVSRNKPYSGGFFTEHHGRPLQNRHAIQIEINRSLYMTETSHEKNAGFKPLQRCLSDLCRKLCDWAQANTGAAGTSFAQAAE